MVEKIYKRIVLVLSIIMLATSCQNNGYEFPKAPEQVFLNEENMPPVEYFTLENVELPEDAQLDEDYYLHADTLLFTVQNKRPNPYILSVYNLKTKNLIAGYFTKGKGPGELISAHCIFRNNEIFLVDGVQNKVSVLNIDSIAMLRYDYNPTIVNTDGVCMEYTRCVSDTLICVNRFHFYGFGYDNVPEFLKISCVDGKCSDEYLPKKINGIGPMNINGRNSFFNKHTRQYVLAWKQFPYINIYDENFKLQKQYIGPDDHSQRLVDYGHSLTFVPDTTSSRFYMVGCQTENYIFCLNDRAYGVRIDMKPTNVEIYCFDRSLNLVRRFRQKDPQPEFLLLPSYCEETGNLYFYVYDEGSDDYMLCKCVFDK